MPELDRQELKFYAKEQAQILALQGGQVDVLAHFSVSGGEALLNDPYITIIELRSAAHREMHMRNDKEPFNDKRVRQAMALLARPPRDGRRACLAAKSDVGNDSPFAPFTRRPTSRRPAQAGCREGQAAARRQAGTRNGFSVTLNTCNDFELPDLAAAAAEQRRGGRASSSS